MKKYRVTNRHTQNVEKNDGKKINEIIMGNRKAKENRKKMR